MCPNLARQPDRCDFRSGLLQLPLGALSHLSRSSVLQQREVFPFSSLCLFGQMQTQQSNTVIRNKTAELTSPSGGGLDSIPFKPCNLFAVRKLPTERPEQNRLTCSTGQQPQNDLANMHDGVTYRYVLPSLHPLLDRASLPILYKLYHLCVRCPTSSKCLHLPKCRREISHPLCNEP